jgi:hypothetical protein
MFWGWFAAAACFSGGDAVRAVGPPQKLRRRQQRRRRPVWHVVVCVVSCRVVWCVVWYGLVVTFPAVSYSLLFKPPRSHTDGSIFTPYESGAFHRMSASKDVRPRCVLHRLLVGSSHISLPPHFHNHHSLPAYCLNK